MTTEGIWRSNDGCNRVTLPVQTANPTADYLARRSGSSSELFSCRFVKAAGFNTLTRGTYVLVLFLFFFLVLFFIVVLLLFSASWCSQNKISVDDHRKSVLCLTSHKQTHSLTHAREGKRQRDRETDKYGKPKGSNTRVIPPGIPRGIFFFRADFSFFRARFPRWKFALVTAKLLSEYWLERSS